MAEAVSRVHEGPSEQRVLTPDDYAAICVPERYRRTRADRIPNQKDLVAYVRRYADAEAKGRGMYLWGPVGTGKSHTLAYLGATCRATVLQEQRFGLGYVRFYYSGTLIQDLRSADREKWTEAEECNLLLLDDLGAPYEHPWMLGMLQDLIEERHSAMLPTCFTSNVAPGELRRRPGYERIGNRLRETAWIVEFSGESLREPPEPLRGSEL